MLCFTEKVQFDEPSLKVLPSKGVNHWLALAGYDIINTLALLKKIYSKVRPTTSPLGHFKVKYIPVTFRQGLLINKIR